MKKLQQYTSVWMIVIAAAVGTMGVAGDLVATGWYGWLGIQMLDEPTITTMTRGIAEAVYQNPYHAVVESNDGAIAAPDFFSENVFSGNRVGIVGGNKNSPLVKKDDYYHVGWGVDPEENWACIGFYKKCAGDHPCTITPKDLSVAFCARVNTLQAPVFNGGRWEADYDQGLIVSVGYAATVLSQPANADGEIPNPNMMVAEDQWDTEQEIKAGTAWLMNRFERPYEKRLRDTVFPVMVVSRFLWISCVAYLVLAIVFLIRRHLREGQALSHTRTARWAYLIVEAARLHLVDEFGYYLENDDLETAELLIGQRKGEIQRDRRDRDWAELERRAESVGIIDEVRVLRGQDDLDTARHVIEQVEARLAREAAFYMREAELAKQPPPDPNADITAIEALLPRVHERSVEADLAARLRDARALEGKERRSALHAVRRVLEGRGIYG
ncbi:MAG: hypothetical protein AAB932_02125 [Patescibacteria group bacterium]